MIKKIIAVVFFILGVSFIAELSSIYASYNQDSASIKKTTPVLQSLVGQKCKIFLKNGGEISGTLWNVGKDFLTVKVKKGPLYSKEEKFGYSEVDYLEDSNGIRIVANSKSRKPSVNNTNSPNQTNKNSIPIFIKTKEKVKEKAPRLREKTKLSSDFPSKSKNKSKITSDKASIGEKVTPGAQVISHMPKEEKEGRVNASKPIRFTNKNSKKFDSKGGTAIAKDQNPLEANTEVASPLTGENKKLRILKYQTIALFSATILALTLIVVLKIKSRAGYSYVENSLFSSSLVKMKGQYGVIDQGLDDGVKVEDLIKFYRKLGRQVDFMGKAKVIKVADKYAAVQLVKDTSNVSLEIGDVGFRYRSSLFVAAEAVRRFIGKSFNKLAKEFDYVATNFGMKTEEPGIEVELIEENLENKKCENKTTEETKTIQNQFSGIDEPRTNLQNIDEGQTTDIAKQNNNQKINIDNNFSNNEPEIEFGVFDDLPNSGKKKDEEKNMVSNKSTKTNKNFMIDTEDTSLESEFVEEKMKHEKRKNRQLKDVEVSQVIPNPFQPRESFDPSALEELKQTISEKGLIQPISVRETDSGYELIAGERRLRAVRDLGLERIPAYVLDVDGYEEMMELSLIENIQRENLNPIDEANAYQTLISKCNLTQEEIAQKVGKDRATIANLLRLLKLPNAIQKSLIQGKISMGHARALLSLPDISDQIELWKSTIQEKYSVRQVEQVVKNVPKQPDQRIMHSPDGSILVESG